MQSLIYWHWNFAAAHSRLLYCVECYFSPSPPISYSYDPSFGTWRRPFARARIGCKIFLSLICAPISFRWDKMVARGFPCRIPDEFVCPLPLFQCGIPSHVAHVMTWISTRPHEKYLCSSGTNSRRLSNSSCFWGDMFRLRCVRSLRIVVAKINLFSSY